jgi:hypothetical protein
MRESRTYGSVRGALSNERPYREACAEAERAVFLLRQRIDDEVANLIIVGGCVGKSRANAPGDHPLAI